MTIRISPDTRARIKARREHFTLLRTSQEVPEVLPEIAHPSGLAAALATMLAINNPSLKPEGGKP